MQQLPNLFNASGEFVEPPDTSSLFPEAVKRLDKVRSTYAAVQIAEKADEAKQIELDAAEKAQAMAAAAVKPFGEYSFQKLWEQSVKGV